jgi:hypothetical protein
MALILVAVAVGACAFGLVASLVISWASGKSALWNIGFGVALALAGAGLLVVGAMLLMRRFSI